MAAQKFDREVARWVTAFVMVAGAMVLIAMAVTVWGPIVFRP
jgi:hypothetical protein